MRADARRVAAGPPPRKITSEYGDREIKAQPAERESGFADAAPGDLPAPPRLLCRPPCFAIRKRRQERTKKRTMLCRLFVAAYAAANKPAYTGRGPAGDGDSEYASRCASTGSGGSGRRLRINDLRIGVCPCRLPFRSVPAARNYFSVPFSFASAPETISLSLVAIVTAGAFRRRGDRRGEAAGARSAPRPAGAVRRAAIAAMRHRGGRI